MRKGGTAMLSLAALAVLSPDERGFVEDIYLKYEKKLYAEALGITGNRHDAEDAVENAVLGVIGNISRFIGKSDREIASQLYIYTKYAAIDIDRKRARRRKFCPTMTKRRRSRRTTDQQSPSSRYPPKRRTSCVKPSPDCPTSTATSSCSE